MEKICYSGFTFGIVLTYTFEGSKKNSSREWTNTGTDKVPARRSWKDREKSEDEIIITVRDKNKK